MTDFEREREREKERERQTDRQTDRQTGRQRKIQADRRTKLIAYYDHIIN